MSHRNTLLPHMCYPYVSRFRSNHLGVCEVYSSLMGVTYRNIVCVYQERSVRLINGIRSSYQNEKPIIEYGLMPSYKDKTKSL